MLEEFRRFASDYDVQLAILSRNRSDVLANYSDKIARDYVLFYCGDGYDREYRGCIERVEVPRELEGRSAAANFALRYLDNKVVFLLGDDVTRFQWLGAGDHALTLDPDGVHAMMINLVINALDVGVGLFGINDVDITKASPFAPFHFRSMLSGLVGFNRTELPNIWFDERQKLKEDYDLTLEYLKRDRLVFKDLRYVCQHDINTLKGGNMEFRTADREDAEARNMQEWWGTDVIRWYGFSSQRKGQGKKGNRTPRLVVRP